MKWFAAAVLWAMAFAQSSPGPAYFIRNLDNPRERRESRRKRIVPPGATTRAGVALKNSSGRSAS